MTLEEIMLLIELVLFAAILLPVVKLTRLERVPAPSRGKRS